MVKRKMPRNGTAGKSGLASNGGTTRSTIVKDRNGNILSERIDVLDRWREYVEGLYRDDRGEKPEFDGCEPGPPIHKK